MKQQIMLRSAAVEDYDGNLAVKQDAAINLNEYTFDIIKAVDVLDNAVRVETESKSDEIVCVAVPYSKGWSAKIDGNTAKIYKMNDMYMGIEVPAGEHIVELNYFTPGLKWGYIYI